MITADMMQHDGVFRNVTNYMIAEHIAQGERHEWNARPFLMVGARVSRDGNKWCCLFGENLQEGMAAFGDTPEEAARAFDAAWYGENPTCAEAEKTEEPTFSEWLAHNIDVARADADDPDNGSQEWSRGYFTALETVAKRVGADFEEASDDADH